jgi:hypothetical protein
MNKRVIDWNNYEENFWGRWAKKDLEKSKSGSIAFIEDISRLTHWEDFHSHWEGWLSSSDYWKNWREKINSFETEKEVNFYTSRLEAFMNFVEKYTRKDISRYCGRVIEGVQQWDPKITPKLIEQELKRLENISPKEFKKEDKFADVGFKELSTEEILNDPWFNKEIDKFFGLENGKLPKEEEKSNGKTDDNQPNKNEDGNIDYQTWTKEQLISEINHLKSENEQLKNNQTLTGSEQQERLQRNQQKLEQIASYVSVDSKPNNSSNNFSISWVVGGGVLVTASLIGLLIVRKKKKR